MIVPFTLWRMINARLILESRFRTPYWGKGYGEEASRRLLDYLFVELNLHRVVAECDVDNIASFTLLEKLGFRREAHLIENIWFKGAWASEFHYAVLEREWKNP